MAAIGREGGESRSAAAREARQGRSADREVPVTMAREGIADDREVFNRNGARVNEQRASDVAMTGADKSSTQNSNVQNGQGENRH